MRYYRKNVFISSDLIPFSLTFTCVKIEVIVTMKMLYRTIFFKNGTKNAVTIIQCYL